MDKYFRTATTVSLINYHFVFCPRYRRKIFDIPHVEDRFSPKVDNNASRNGRRGGFGLRSETG